MVGPMPKYSFDGSKSIYEKKWNEIPIWIFNLEVSIG
jgi:SPX domain protein involved in polyphosphate accumulation